MAEDWLADVRQYASGADENVVGAIVRYLGIALRNRDSSLVSFSDPVEVGRVRDNFLRKKLALSAPDDVLDEGLNWVKGLMSADRTKNRVTVYYLLAHYFGKLDLFGGVAGTSASSLGGGGKTAAGVAAVAGLGAGAAIASASGELPDAALLDPTQTAPRDPTQTAPRAVAAEIPPASTQRSGIASVDEDRVVGSGWPRWLTWLLIALAVIGLILLLKSCLAEKPVASVGTAPSEAVVPPVEQGAGNASIVAQDPVGSAAIAVPKGSGVISEVRDNKPLLTVYFDSGKAAVSNDFAAATDTLKAYLNTHPDAKLAVSGYNDPSGNAALNAELSKNRAQAVATALAASGIPKGSVELVKPADTTSATVTPEQARRVEVTVQ